MIYIALIVGLKIIIIYSCIAASTKYDQVISDREQEVFLQRYNQ